jgi:hypothetical protein
MWPRARRIFDMLPSALRSWIVCVLIVLTTATSAQAALNAGDIAFVMYNADASPSDTVAFVALVDIPAGEQINFTDNGWTSSNSWRTGEGVQTYTAPAGGLSKGTVVTLQLTAPSLTLGTGGDQIIAYQGASTMIAALNNDGNGVWQANATSGATSALPQGLVNGTTAVALVEIDNARYNGVLTGSRDELLAAINNNANWERNDTTAYTWTRGSLSVADDAVVPGSMAAVSHVATLTGSVASGNVTVSGVVPTGANRLMLVGISWKPDSASAIISVAFGGTPLTSIGTSYVGNDHRVDMYQLVNPSTDSANVVVSFNGSTKGSHVSVSTFAGVNQATPLGTRANATGDNTVPTVNVASASGDLVFDVLTSEKDGTAVSVGAGQTSLWTTGTTNITEIRSAGSTEPATGANTVMSWSNPGKKWALSAVAIKPAQLTAQAITFDAPGNRIYGDGDFQLSASATSGLDVSFTSSNPGVATVNGSTVAIVGAGSTTITATQSGNGDFLAAEPVQQTLTIDPKVITLTGASATSRAYDGTTTVAVSGGSLVGLVGADAVSLGGSPTGTVDTATAGTGKEVTVTGYSISGAQSGNYSLSQPTGLTVDITKATPTITAAATASAITFGQALSTSTFSGGTTTPADGTWSWNSPSTTPAVGTAGYAATFTPADTTNYENASSTVSVTVNPAVLPENSELVGNLDGSFTLKIGTETLENVSYLYTGRSVGGLNHAYTFLAHSNTNAPVAPGFYTVIATAAGNYTGGRTNEYAVAGPLALPAGQAIEVTKISGATTVRFNRSTLLGGLQRVATNGTLSNGATGLTWTGTERGLSQMPAGYENPTMLNTVTNSSSFVTLTPPGAGASTSDSFTLTVSDGVTPVNFPVTVVSTNAPPFDLQVRKLVPIAGDPENMKAIFLTRPNRTVELEFFSATDGEFVPLRDKNAVVSSDVQNGLSIQQGRQSADRISTGSSGVLELKVPKQASSMAFRARPVVSTNQTTP